MCGKRFIRRINHLNVCSALSKACSEGVSVSPIPLVQYKRFNNSICTNYYHHFPLDCRWTTALMCPALFGALLRFFCNATKWMAPQIAPKNVPIASDIILWIFINLWFWPLILCEWMLIYVKLILSSDASVIHLIFSLMDNIARKIAWALKMRKFNFGPIIARSSHLSHTHPFIRTHLARFFFSIALTPNLSSLFFSFPNATRKKRRECIGRVNSLARSKWSQQPPIYNAVVDAYNLNDTHSFDVFTWKGFPYKATKQPLGHLLCIALCN